MLLEGFCHLPEQSLGLAFSSNQHPDYPEVAATEVTQKTQGLSLNATSVKFTPTPLSFYRKKNPTHSKDSLTSPYLVQEMVAQGQKVVLQLDQQQQVKSNTETTK